MSETNDDGTTTCPVCSVHVINLDAHIENSEDCLRAVEMGLVEEV